MLSRFGRKGKAVPGDEGDSGGGDATASALGSGSAKPATAKRLGVLSRKDKGPTTTGGAFTEESSQDEEASPSKRRFRMPGRGKKTTTGGGDDSDAPSNSPSKRSLMPSMKMPTLSKKAPAGVDTGESEAGSDSNVLPTRRGKMPSLKMPGLGSLNKGKRAKASQEQEGQEEGDTVDGPEAAPSKAGKMFAGMKSMMSRSKGAPEADEEGGQRPAEAGGAVPSGAPPLQMPMPPLPIASRRVSRSSAGDPEPRRAASERSESGSERSLLHHQQQHANRRTPRRAGSRTPSGASNASELSMAPPKSATETEMARPARRGRDRTGRRRREKENLDAHPEEASGVLDKAATSEELLDGDIAGRERAEGGDRRKAKRKEKSHQHGKKEVEMVEHPNGGTPKRTLRHRAPPSYSRVLRIDIQATDALEPVSWLSMPIVRMHMVNQETGEYVLRRSPGQQHPQLISELEQEDYLSRLERPVLMTIPRFGGAPQENPASPGEGAAQEGEPALAAKWSSAVMDFIPAVQTAPYNLRSRPHTMLAAAWNEEVTIDEDADVLTGSGTMLLFEILQPPESMMEKSRTTSHGPMRPLAWAFLKLVGDHGPVLGDLKLQLYKYQKTDGTMCLRSAQPELGARANTGAKKAYVNWWREQFSRKRHKYPSYLQIKAEIVDRHEPEVVVTAPSRDVRPKFMIGGWGGYEMGRYDILEEAGLGGIGVDGPATPSSYGSDEDMDDLALLRARLQRSSRELCQIPNSMYHKFPGTELGATILSFAHSSTMLAVAVGGKTLWGIQVWEAISGALMVTLTMHHDLIYDLSWSPDDQNLVTASSDYTAKVWDVSHLDAQDPRAPVKRTHPVNLQHASFVYCAAFHPGDPRVAATGCYDHSIYLWDWEASPPVMLHSIKMHTAPVNSIVFDPLGKRLYSGDADGFIRMWSADSRTQNAAEGLRVLKVMDELRDEPISRLKIHPNGRRLMAITKRSRLVTFDIGKLFAINMQYSGVRCSKCPLQAAFSPDGRYIISGSEDGRVYLWDTEHHDPHHMQHVTFRGPPVYSISWSPVVHAFAICTFTPIAPVQVYSFQDHLPPVRVVSHPSPTRRSMGTERTTQERPATARMSATMTERMARTSNLPDKLTPEHLADMLSSIRASVRSRGLSPSKSPLRDEKLVVRDDLPEARTSPLTAPRSKSRIKKDGDGVAVKLDYFRKEEEASGSKTPEIFPAGGFEQPQERVGRAEMRAPLPPIDPQPLSGEVAMAPRDAGARRQRSLSRDVPRRERSSSREGSGRERRPLERSSSRGPAPQRERSISRGRPM